jgi:hypothetical protein
MWRVTAPRVLTANRVVWREKVAATHAQWACAALSPYMAYR